MRRPRFRFATQATTRHAMTIASIFSAVMDTGGAMSPLVRRR